jgi:redox-sensitive bicupin YhaK (pirin superfamily)
MAVIRPVIKVTKSMPTIEGAGVRLNRVFGFHQLPLYDPFLLMDDFHSNNPDDYMAGFPWHPHRGIETITYILHGQVEHGDSLGNRGIIQEGEVQWMTAGSGIIHQEMPKKSKDNLLWGFQLWANLPASDKMMKPKYRDITREMIPEVRSENGVTLRIISGTVQDVSGPVDDIMIQPEYLDISMPENSILTHPVPVDKKVFAYIISGEAYFDTNRRDRRQVMEGVYDVQLKEDGLINNKSVALFGPGDTVEISTAARAVRFLLISGKPLNQPIAWHGPIVMNTQEELAVAFKEYQEGTFIKERKDR